MSANYKLYRSGDAFYLYDPQSATTLAPTRAYNDLRPDLFVRLSRWTRLDRVTNRYIAHTLPEEMLHNLNQYFVDRMMDYWAKVNEERAKENQPTRDSTIAAAKAHKYFYQFVVMSDRSAHQVRALDSVPEDAIGVFSFQNGGNFYLDVFPDWDGSADELKRELVERFRGQTDARGPGVFNILLQRGEVVLDG